MTYIYDILLNFNNDFYEFYEWEKNDIIYHIKKIPIFKVTTTFLDDLLTKKIIIDDPLTFEMLGKCEYFDTKKVKTLKYACLFTDTYRVFGVLLDDNHRIIKISDLLLDEAYDALEISKRCLLRNITYNIVKPKKEHHFLTRNEIKIQKTLINELKVAYKEKDNLKLEYLYFEYFNESEQDINLICERLMTTLKDEINDKHQKLYELLKLANSKNKLSNLTN